MSATQSPSDYGLPLRPPSSAPREERMAWWRACIAAQATSGLGVREFIAATGVNKAAFYTWRRKLADETAGGSSDAPRFIEVDVAAPAAASGPSAMLPGPAWLAELSRLSAALHAHLAGGPR